MRRTPSVFAACVAGCLVLLTGCQGGGQPVVSPSQPPVASPAPSVDAVADAAALDKIELTAEPGKEPTLNLTPPIKVTAPTVRVVANGTGATIELNKGLVAQVVTINGEDGKQEGNSYGLKPELLVTDEVNLPNALLEALVGAQARVRVLFAAPLEGKTTLWAFEVLSVIDLPAEASGVEEAVPSGLPLISYGDSPTSDGHMPIMEANQGVPPDKLVVQPIITGEGAKITDQSKLIVQMCGWLWDGKAVSNTWEGGVGVPLVLEGTIKGWREGLVGQTVGSQVLLVVPPDMAFGQDGRGKNIPGDATLVYVIDVLVGI